MMASAEVILLSSSPSRSLITTTPPRDLDYFLMSSSPGFPSPSQLLLNSRRPSLQSESRVNAIPVAATKGFTCASCLLDSETTVDIAAISFRTSHSGQPKLLRSLSPSMLECRDAEADHAAPPPAKKPRAPRKKSKDPQEGSKRTATKDNTAASGTENLLKSIRVRKSKDVGGNKDDAVRGDPAPKKPRARKSKDGGEITAPTIDVVSTKKPRVRKSKDGSTEDVIVPGDVPLKKSRVRKNKDEGQTTIPKTRIIKPSAAQGVEDGVKSNKTPVRKRTLPSTELVIAEGPSRIIVSNEPLGLDISVPRKRDWTPLRDNDGVTTGKLATSGEIVQQGIRDALIGNIPEVHNSSTLHSDFSYVKPSGLCSAIDLKRMVNGEALTKRQKLEVDYGCTLRIFMC